MKGVYKTPGVYIEEKNAFTTSIVAVPTAVPAFIGYTEKAIKGTKPLTFVPTRIKSFAEFQEMFGGPPSTEFGLTDNADNDAVMEPYTLAVDTKTQYFLYNSMKLFYTNGGGPCWIVSVGDYKTPVEKGDPVEKGLERGLNSLVKIMEPTMLVIPDAVLLEDSGECYSLQMSMIDQGGDPKMRDRIAILDVHGGDEDDMDTMITNFRNGVTPKNPDFGAVYYPWLVTSVTSSTEVSSANLTAEGLAALITMIDATIDAPANAEADPEKKAALTEKATKIKEQTTKKLNDAQAALEGDDAAAKEKAKSDIKFAEQALLATSPLYKDVMNDIREELNIMPPSGAIAGLISYVDNAMGVARSPANVGLSSVVRPTMDLSNEDQEDLNLPLDGKAVNAIRSFPGKGVLVWGARTLDGNSQDWRYISVRRAVIMIEQSIKIAMGAFVFEPNNQNTWLDVQGSITNFLTTQWSNGVLVGATPGEAFEVSVGLGATMTPNDILDGIMRISVKLAVVRPAEFIVITFQQKMQTS